MWWCRKRRHSEWLAAIGLCAALHGGCGADSDEASDLPSNDSDAPRADAGSAGGSGRDAGAPSGEGDDDLPEESETTIALESPQAGKTSVYIPNPDTNRVAVVNASTFAIESLAVGTRPVTAATVPGQDVALVLNAGTRDAALLRTEQGKTSVKKLDVGHEANAIAIAPGGLSAIIYLDARTAGTTAQSFQDLTVVDLTPGAEKTRRMSVGFRPRGVSFTRDGARAFVVTEDGVSVLDFAELARGPTIARLVGLGDALGSPQAVDVQVTPDGTYALARVPGESTLRLVDLQTGKIENLALASLPGIGAPTTDADGGMRALELTDLDIAPSGTFAVAVLRDRGALVRIPLPGGFRDPSLTRVRRLEQQLVGSITLAKSGKSALAYTTAAPIESVVLIDDLESDAPVRGIRLRKAVRAVALSDDGARALILHAPVTKQTPAANEDERIDAAEGYTLLDTTSGFTKLQLTAASVGERDLLITPDRTRLFAMLRDVPKAVRALDVVDLESFQVSQLPLARAPTSIGFLPDAARVFVGQAGEGGMITFLDARTGAKVRDVSGFEIASRIRQ